MKYKLKQIIVAYMYKKTNTKATYILAPNVNIHL